jgi:hypothetical protein
MISLKPLLFSLLVGTSAAFALVDPRVSLAGIAKSSSGRQLVEGAVDLPPPELKVRQKLQTTSRALTSDELMTVVA